MTTTVATAYGGYLRVVLVGTMGTATAMTVYENSVAYDYTGWSDNDPSEPFDINEHLAQDKAARKLRYQLEREREASTALHFGGHRPPRLEARQHSDPLRHHRLKGFRRASRRDQTEFRTEGTNR